MAPNYQIRATVFDIRQNEPLDNERFLIDTNVWLWITYTRASSGFNTPQQVSDYSNYFQKCLRKQCQLLFCGFTLAELAHVIEKTEREIYSATIGAEIQAKEFRHNYPAERATVVNEIESAWAQVRGLGECLSTNIDENVVNVVE